MLGFSVRDGLCLVFVSIIVGDCYQWVSVTSGYSASLAVPSLLSSVCSFHRTIIVFCMLVCQSFVGFGVPLLHLFAYWIVVSCLDMADSSDSTHGQQLRMYHRLFDRISKLELDNLQLRE